LNTNASHASQLRVISLFEDLQPAELLQIAGLCTMQACEKHSQIMGEQDQTTDVFFILAGSVRISSYTEAGREVIFSEMHAGDIFGEFSAVDRLPRSASIVALSDCLMARMPSAKFFEVLRGHADISVRLIELLVFKIRKMSERVFEVSALGVRERLRLATEGQAFRNGVVVQPAPTHYEIAARIGSHREAVTREFNRLEAENIIEVRRKQIRIIDLERLKHADGE
jgi:CRP/FNR family cyclic AMP-dependent transcriptional regulator